MNAAGHCADVEVSAEEEVEMERLAREQFVRDCGRAADEGIRLRDEMFARLKPALTYGPWWAK